MITIKAAISARTKGRAAREIRSMDMSARFAATYRFKATGGVTVPIARLTVIITPNHIGSQPKCLITGIRMGRNT